MILPSDPKAGYLAHQKEIDEAVGRVLNSGWYILGTEVEQFEKEFAAFIGARNAVAVANGTDAVALSLRALGLQPGDAVLTVSHTAVATVAAIEMGGFQPVLVDIDPGRYTMCPDSLSKAIANCGRLAKRLKAIVPVHLYGQPCDMDAILDIARQNGLLVSEDCSQSHGAAVNGRTTGTLGHAAAFSLYPTKNLGAFGDAGIITTMDENIGEQLRILRQYGWRERNRSEIPGVNSRLDELQAAILRVRIRHLAEMNSARQRIADIYDQGLRGVCTIPFRAKNCTHVFHQYVIRTENRNLLQRKLKDAGVGTMIHYPLAVHQQPAYMERLHEIVSLCTTERVVSEILSLPIYPELPIVSANRVVDIVSSLI
ncbi:MAG: DegT/DnrJ/EryC1/StrS family aminotransferase [Planctomycetaceae bacterium]|nr:DegT/DnrJ/EryC1/StrS family aminotransferase [Planctomycetaceae bacterium]